VIKYQCNGYNYKTEKYTFYNYMLLDHLDLATLNKSIVYNYFRLSSFKNEGFYIKKLLMLRFEFFIYNLYYLETKIYKREFIFFNKFSVFVYFKKNNITIPVFLVFYNN